MAAFFFPAPAAWPAGLGLPAYFGAEHPLINASFLVSLVALLGAALFFFGRRHAVPPRWQLNLIIASLSCVVAGNHYYYMLVQYVHWGLSPTAFRYLNWLCSGSLLCTQFYVLLRPWGPSRRALGRLLLAHGWLVGFAYLGESAGSYWILLWGAIASLGYVSVLHEIWFGPLAYLVDTVPDQTVGRAYSYLSSFWLGSWLLYPLGYLSQPYQVLAGLPLNRDLVYNIADVVHKIGFGVVLYLMARQAGRAQPAGPPHRHPGRGGEWKAGHYRRPCAY